MKIIYITIGAPAANQDEFKYLCKPFKRQPVWSPYRYQQRQYY